MILEVKDLRLAFGGVACRRRAHLLRRSRARSSRHRAQRRGQDLGVQLRHRVLPADRGPVRLRDKDLIGLRPSAVAARGVARTFQNLRLFGELSVLDNVRAGTAPVAAAERPRRAAAHPPLPPQRAREHRARPTTGWTSSGCAATGPAPPATCPYGEQRRVEIARALARRPDAAAARRARRRAQPRREGRDARPHPPHPGSWAWRSCSSSTTWAWSWRCPSGWSC